MKIVKAVVTAAGRAQRHLPLQSVVDRDGYPQPASRFFVEELLSAGAEPANFLDVGGGANAEMVENGFRIILSDKKVKGILINIFGGILRCDVLAQGVVQAAKKINLSVPVVVRMEGTNVEEGRRILSESGLKLINATDLADAAGKVAELVA